jgi:DNA-directed RNA polymerase subunit RPC12/RpoP
MSYFCKGCGAEYSTEQTVCNRCGEKVVSSDSVTMLHANRTPAPVLNSFVSTAPQQPVGSFGLAGAIMPEGFGLTGVFAQTKPLSVSLLYNAELNGYEVSGLRNDEAIVEIPAEYNGKAVLIIGQSAFANGGLISVTIPDSVHTIGESAFEGCTQLVEVKGGRNVKNVCAKAFKGCIALKSCSFTGLSNVDATAFAGCYELGLAAEESMKDGGNNTWL